MHERELAAEYPGPQRVVEVIDQAAEEFGDRELIVTPTGRLSFGEVDRASRSLAKRLIAAGVGKGTRVGAHLPHSAEWMVAFFAVTRIGATFMSFSAAYKPAELRRALQLGDVHLLLGTTESWHGGPYARFLEEALPELGRLAEGAPTDVRRHLLCCRCHSRSLLSKRRRPVPRSAAPP